MAAGRARDNPGSTLVGRLDPARRAVGRGSVGPEGKAIQRTVLRGVFGMLKKRL